MCRVHCCIIRPFVIFVCVYDVARFLHVTANCGCHMKEYIYFSTPILLMTPSAWVPHERIYLFLNTYFINDSISIRHTVTNKPHTKQDVALWFSIAHGVTFLQTDPSWWTHWATSRSMNNNQEWQGVGTVFSKKSRSNWNLQNLYWGSFLSPSNVIWSIMSHHSLWYRTWHVLGYFSRWVWVERTVRFYSQRSRWVWVERTVRLYSQRSSYQPPV